MSESVCDEQREREIFAGGSALEEMCKLVLIWSIKWQGWMNEWIRVDTWSVQVFNEGW